MELVGRLGHKLKATAANFQMIELQNIGARLNKFDASKEDANALTNELKERIIRAKAAIEAL